MISIVISILLISMLALCFGGFIISTSLVQKEKDKPATDKTGAITWIMCR